MMTKRLMTMVCPLVFVAGAALAQVDVADAAACCPPMPGVTCGAAPMGAAVPVGDAASMGLLFFVFVLAIDQCGRDQSQGAFPARECLEQNLGMQEFLDRRAAADDKSVRLATNTSQVRCVEEMQRGLQQRFGALNEEVGPSRHTRGAD